LTLFGKSYIRYVTEHELALVCSRRLQHGRPDALQESGRITRVSQTLRDNLNRVKADLRVQFDKYMSSLDTADGHLMEVETNADAGSSAYDDVEISHQSLQNSSFALMNTISVADINMQCRTHNNYIDHYDIPGTTTVKGAISLAKETASLSEKAGRSMMDDIEPGLYSRRRQEIAGIRPDFKCKVIPAVGENLYVAYGYKYVVNSEGILCSSTHEWESSRLNSMK
jgi:hypothetical protein